MTSSQLGASISHPGIGDIGTTGFWLTLPTSSWFLAFDEHPWFAQASRQQLEEVELLQGEHLRWESLDVDLCVDSLEHPENYPLRAVYPWPG